MPRKQTLYEIERRVHDLEIENDFLRRQFLAVVEINMDAILLTTPDGGIYSANQAACDLYQMTEEELIAGGRSAVVDPEDKRLAETLEKRARTGKFCGEFNQEKRTARCSRQSNDAVVKDTWRFWNSLSSTRWSVYRPAEIR